MNSFKKKLKILNKILKNYQNEFLENETIKVNVNKEYFKIITKDKNNSV